MAHEPLTRVCALCALSESARCDLGPMLGPISGLGGESSCYVHRWCALWSPEVYQTDEGTIRAVGAAVRRGRALRCAHCSRRGATVGCALEHCAISFHLPCAHEAGCSFQADAFTITCRKHSKRKGKGATGSAGTANLVPAQPPAPFAAGPPDTSARPMATAATADWPPWSPAFMARPAAGNAARAVPGTAPAGMENTAWHGADTWRRRTGDMQAHKRPRRWDCDSKHKGGVDVEAMVSHVLRGRGALVRAFQEAHAMCEPGSERAAAEETDEAEWAAKEAARGVKDVLRLAPIILAGCGGGPEAVAAARQYAEAHGLTAGAAADASAAAAVAAAAAAVPVRIWGAEAPGFESLGGMEQVVRALREMALLPLLQPGLMSRLGLHPPRGILLHGVPGAGKTAAVRALAGECARAAPHPVALFVRKGADCLGKYAGDAERTLRLLFQHARALAPSIIFLDELDALAPARSVRASTSDQVHASVVSTLLSLMDGLADRGQVLVIGATNRPDSLDPALRRPGRFDREVRCGLPDTAGRAAILSAVTRAWSPPPSPELLQEVAAATEGYAGADIAALACSAVLAAARRVRGPEGLLPDAQVLGVVPPGRAAGSALARPTRRHSTQHTAPAVGEAAVGKAGQGAAGLAAGGDGMGVVRAAGGTILLVPQAGAPAQAGSASKQADTLTGDSADMGVTTHEGDNQDVAAGAAATRAGNVPAKEQASPSGKVQLHPSPNKSPHSRGSRSPSPGHQQPSRNAGRSAAVRTPGTFLAAFSGFGSEFGDGGGKAPHTLGLRRPGSRSRSGSATPPPEASVSAAAAAAPAQAQQHGQGVDTQGRGQVVVGHEGEGAGGEGQAAKRQKRGSRTVQPHAHHQVHWADEAPGRPILNGPAAAPAADPCQHAGSVPAQSEQEHGAVLMQVEAASQLQVGQVADGGTNMTVQGPQAAGPPTTPQAGAAPAPPQAPQAEPTRHSAPTWVEEVHVEACDWRTALAAAPLPAAKREPLAILGGGEAGVAGEPLPWHLSPLLAPAVGTLAARVVHSGLQPLPEGLVHVATAAACSPCTRADLRGSSSAGTSTPQQHGVQSTHQAKVSSPAQNLEHLEQVLVEWGAAASGSSTGRPVAQLPAMKPHTLGTKHTPQAVSAAPAHGSAAAAGGCRAVRLLMCDPPATHPTHPGAGNESLPRASGCSQGGSETAARGFLRLLQGGAQVVRLALPSLVVSGEGDPVAGAVAAVAAAVAAVRSAGGSGGGHQPRLLVLHLSHVDMWAVGSTECTSDAEGAENSGSQAQEVQGATQAGATSCSGTAPAARGAATGTAQAGGRAAGGFLSPAHPTSTKAVPGGSPVMARRLGGGAPAPSLPLTPRFLGPLADHTNVACQQMAAQLLPLASPAHARPRAGQTHAAGAVLQALGLDPALAFGTGQDADTTPVRAGLRQHDPNGTPQHEPIELYLEAGATQAQAHPAAAGPDLPRAAALAPLWTVLEQLVSQVPSSQPLLLLATSSVPHTQLPPDMVSYFGGPPTLPGAAAHATAVATPDVNGPQHAAHVQPDVMKPGMGDLAGEGEVGGAAWVLQLCTHAAGSQPLQAAIARAAQHVARDVLLPRLLAASQPGASVAGAASPVPAAGSGMTQDGPGPSAQGARCVAGDDAAPTTTPALAQEPSTSTQELVSSNMCDGLSAAERETALKLHTDIQARIRAMAAQLATGHGAQHVRAPQLPQSQCQSPSDGNPLGGGGFPAAGALQAQGAMYSAQQEGQEQHLPAAAAPSAGYLSLQDVAARAMRGGYQTLDAFRAAAAAVVAGARALCPHRAAAASTGRPATALAASTPMTAPDHLTANGAAAQQAAAMEGVTGGSACCVGAAAAAAWMDIIDAGCSAAQQELGLLDEHTARLLRRFHSSSSSTQHPDGQLTAQCPLQSQQPQGRDEATRRGCGLAGSNAVVHATPAAAGALEMDETDAVAGLTAACDMLQGCGATAADAARSQPPSGSSEEGDGAHLPSCSRVAAAQLEGAVAAALAGSGCSTAASLQAATRGCMVNGLRALSELSQCTAGPSDGSAPVVGPHQVAGSQEHAGARARGDVAGGGGGVDGPDSNSDLEGWVRAVCDAMRVQSQ